MNMMKVGNNTLNVLKDLENCSLATFNFNIMDMVCIDGEEFFARSFTCHDLPVTLNGRDVYLNGFDVGSNLKNILTGDLWLFYNTRKCYIYDNTYKELLGELTRIIDPRNQQERIKELGL